MGKLAIVRNLLGALWPAPDPQRRCTVKSYPLVNMEEHESALTFSPDLPLQVRFQFNEVRVDKHSLAWTGGWFRTSW
jgi:hypothetical protein